MAHTLRTKPQVPSEQFRGMMNEWGISREELLKLLPVAMERIDNWRGVGQDDPAPFQYWWILELLADPKVKKWALDTAERVVKVGPETYCPQPFGR